jgi:hypothetical protein
VAFLAILSASSLLGIPLWPGTQHIVTLWPVVCSSLARSCACSARACPGPGWVCRSLLIAACVSRKTLIGSIRLSANVYSRALTTSISSALKTLKPVFRGIS